MFYLVFSSFYVMLDFMVSNGNKQYLLIGVQISMFLMVQARIISQMESVSNVPQHEHHFSGCLDDS